MNWPKQSEVPQFFGKIEVGRDGRPTERWEARALTQINLPYAMRLAWDTDTVVRRMTCHRVVAKSLAAVLGNILSLYGSVEEVQKARMDLFGGCYNFRLTRGGSILSMHSYGIAIDLDPDRNGLGVKYDEKKGMMPQEVVELFAAEGWTWGGKWSRPDAMHFQAATV